VVGYIPRALSAIGIAVLCFGVSSAYDFVGLSGLKGPSTVALWTIFGIGFTLAAGGLITAAVQLSKDRRKALARSLLGVGSLLFVTAMLIAHVGLVLLVLAVPAIVVGLIVAIMALPFPRLFKSRS
jgi:hypothetical protein